MNYCIECMEQLPEKNHICDKCGAVQNVKIPEHYLPIGTILNNRYYVGNSIDENDFEITYIGKDILVDESIVIKEYFPAKLVDRCSEKSLDVFNVECTGSHNYELSKDTFVNEAKALQDLNGLDSLIDLKDVFAENNTAYYIRDYISGVTIEKFVTNNGIIPEDALVKKVIPIIKSLATINSSGIVHCNISPKSIMLLENGSAKLFDFGLAVHSLVASENPLLLEKPSGYIAIETYARKPNLLPSTDVFSLCATLYKGITGVTPPSTLDRHINDDIKSPYALGMTIAPNVEYAIMKGLSLQQEGRYQNMNQLYSAISLLCDNDDINETEALRKNGNAEDSNNSISKPNIRVKFAL